jgi:hypothetical protein
MTIAFSNVVEDVKGLTIDEKEELLFLLNRYLIEERRSEFYQNYRKSREEFQENKLEFSNDITRLKEMINQ